MARPPGLDPGNVHGAAGSSFGSQAWRASGLGWRSCWPLCSQGPSSNTGAGGYAGRDEITSDSTCIYGGPHGPSRPLRRGRINGQRNALSGPNVWNECRLTSTSRTRSIERAGPRCNYKFKPPVLREVPDADDMMVSSMTISAGML